MLWPWRQDEGLRSDENSSPISIPFEFDGRGAPGELPMRSSGWWLQAQPIAPSAAISAAAKSVPTILSAWTFNTLPMHAHNQDLPRGDERIRLLLEIGRRMAVGAVAESDHAGWITRLAA